MLQHLVPDRVDACEGRNTYLVFSCPCAARFQYLSGCYSFGILDWVYVPVKSPRGMGAAHRALRGARFLQVPLIDLEPWYSYVLKTERPEVVEGAPSSTPSRASTTYEPEQKVTVSLLIEISKEIMSLYGKAKKGDASFSTSLLFLAELSLMAYDISIPVVLAAFACVEAVKAASHDTVTRWHMPAYCTTAVVSFARTSMAVFAYAERSRPAMRTRLHKRQAWCKHLTFHLMGVSTLLLGTPFDVASEVLAPTCLLVVGMLAWLCSKSLMHEWLAAHR